MKIVLGVFSIVWFSFIASIANAEDASKSGLSPKYANVRLYQNWQSWGNEGAAQCNTAAHGEFTTEMNKWSDPIRIDTDSRPGGCSLILAIVDPDKAIKGWSMVLEVTPSVPNGDGSQCGRLGKYDIPIVNSVDEARSGTAIVVDTDRRPGGCKWSFSVSGNAVIFGIFYFADIGQESGGQCRGTGTKWLPQSPYPQKKRNGNAVKEETRAVTESFIIDTDDRAGGCQFQFRLQERGQGSFVSRRGI